MRQSIAQWAISCQLSSKIQLLHSCLTSASSSQVLEIHQKGAPDHPVPPPVGVAGRTSGSVGGIASSACAVHSEATQQQHNDLKYGSEAVRMPHSV
jgi:hypothetical protein